MPRNLSIPAELTPRTGPARVATTGAFGAATAAEAVTTAAATPRTRDDVWMRMARCLELDFTLRNGIARSSECAAEPNEVVYGREGRRCRPAAALPIAAGGADVTSSQLPRQRERLGVRRERSSQRALLPRQGEPGTALRPRCAGAARG